MTEVFSPSEALEKANKISMVSFDQLFTSGDAEEQEPDFSELGEFMGKPVVESLNEVIDQIENTPFDVLIFKPTRIIVEFKNFFIEKIPQKVFLTLLNTWPPAISQAAPTVKPMVDLIKKMIHMSKDPIKIMSWLMACVAPRHFGSKSVILQAACQITAKTPQWLFLDAEGTLIICSENKKGLFDEKGKGKPTKAEKTEANEIKFFDEKGKEIFNCKPLDASVAELWVQMFTENKPNLLQFFTPVKDSKIPNTLSRAIIESFSAASGNAIRALFTPNTVKEEDIPKMIEGIMTVSQFTQKVTLNLNTILTAIFEQPHSSVEFLVNEDPLMKGLFTYFAKNFAVSYGQTFVRNLVNYINSKSPINFAEKEPAEVEKIVFTIMKYVLASIQFIPPKIQHFCAMLKAYTTIKFNSYGAVFRVLSTFFAKYVLGLILENPTEFIKELTVVDQETLHNLNRLVQTALTLGKFEAVNPDYASFDKRLSKLSKTIQNFIIELAVIFNVVDGEISNNAPAYTPGTPETAVKASESLYKVIQANTATVSPVVKYQTSEQCFATSTIGWSFAAVEIVFFKTYYEDERQDEMKVAPRATVFDDKMEPHMCTSPDKIPQEVCNTGKFYVRMKKSVKSVVKGAPSETDQVISVQREEVIGADGKKKTIVKKKVHRKKQPKKSSKVEPEVKEEVKEEQKAVEEEKSESSSSSRSSAKENHEEQKPAEEEKHESDEHSYSLSSQELKKAENLVNEEHSSGYYSVKSD